MSLELLNNPFSGNFKDWDKIWENRHMWTEEELVDSCFYFKKFANENGGFSVLNIEMKELLKKFETRFKK